jgi:hypothetical protein
MRGGVRHLRHGRPLRQRRDHRGPAAGAGPVAAPGGLHQVVPAPGADDGRGRARGRDRAAPAAGGRAGGPPAVPLVELRASRLARRAARAGAAARGGADRGAGRDQLRRGAFQPRAVGRRAAADQPGQLLADGPPGGGRSGRGLRAARGVDPRLRHAERRVPVGALAGPARARADRRLVEDEVPPLHRRGGGWEAFQTVLSAAAQVAEKHGVSVSNVATRWVLEQRRSRA